MSCGLRLWWSCRWLSRFNIVERFERLVIAIRVVLIGYDLCWCSNVVGLESICVVEVDAHASGSNSGAFTCGEAQFILSSILNHISRTTSRQITGLFTLRRWQIRRLPTRLRARRRQNQASPHRLPPPRIFSKSRPWDWCICPISARDAPKLKRLREMVHRLEVEQVRRLAGGKPTISVIFYGMDTNRPSTVRVAHNRLSRRGRSP